MRVGIIYHEAFGREGYLVLKSRVKPSFDYMRKIGLLDRENIQVFTPTPAPLELVKRVHSEQHIKMVVEAGYWNIALLSAGSVVLATELLASDKIDAAFAYVGTAGHHASREGFWGFCYLNDIAIAIERARELKLKKFLILDIDPHYGDGTRNIFISDQNVMHINFYSTGTIAFLDLEQNAFSPPRTIQENFDYKFNKFDIGLPADAEDRHFLRELDRVLEIENVKQFDYSICYIVFGHDSHKNDYGGLELTSNFYPEFASKIKKFVEDRKRKLCFVLSGGSNVEVAKAAISGVIEVLSS
jgi:acetoin utilization deacetylase AcuC-like enzyme